MTKLNYFVIFILITSTLLFLGSFSYHKKMPLVEQPLTEKIVSITSSISQTELNSKQTPTFAASSTALYEEKSVLYIIILSLTLAIFAGGLSLYEKSDSTMKTPLITASLLLSSTIIVTTLSIGLI